MLSVALYKILFSLFCILQIMCKIVAILLHFFFMASFTWMLLEGLCLYLSCTRGLYNYGDMRIKYMIMGWGVPVVIVLVSFGVEFPHYGDGTGQRLNPDFK